MLLAQRYVAHTKMFLLLPVVFVMDWKLGNNARASLIARGLVEMRRFGKFFGAQDETFLGLSGAGDLFLTASSTLSRNYRVGLWLRAKSLMTFWFH